MVWTGLDWTELGWAGLGWAELGWEWKGMDSSCDIERTREGEREKKIISNFFHSEHTCVTLVISLSHFRVSVSVFMCCSVLS